LAPIEFAKIRTIRVSQIRVYLSSFVVKETKTPPPVWQWGSQIFVNDQNPTAARRSSSALDSSRFRLPFTREP